MNHQTFAWKRATSWWDDLEVPASMGKNPADLFTWLEEQAPDPVEHDFVLYTDGSGCTEGWGASASIIDRVALVDGARRVVSTDALVSATYGSTVQRRELSALLDGLHEILRIRAGEVHEEAQYNDAERYEISKFGVLHKLTGPDRISVMWFTDRANLAKALLFDENGDVLNARNTETDLWMRYSAMSRQFCVTPMCTKRNTIEGQAACDALCGVARATIKANTEAFTAITNSLPPAIKVSWTQKRPQAALF